MKASRLIKEIAEDISPLDAKKWSEYITRKRITIGLLWKWTRDYNTFIIELRTPIPKLRRRVLLFKRLEQVFVHQSVGVPTSNSNPTSTIRKRRRQVKLKNLAASSKIKPGSQPLKQGCDTVSLQMPARFSKDGIKWPYRTGLLQISTQETITWSGYYELTSEVLETSRQVTENSPETRSNKAMVEKMTTSVDVTHMPTLSGFKYDEPESKCDISTDIISRCSLPNAKFACTEHLDNKTKLPLNSGVAKCSNLADTKQDDVVTDRLMKNE